MNVHKIPLDICLPDDLQIDLWLVQWHTPTPIGFQPIGEPHRSEKARIIEQLTERLRQSAQTAPADRLAMVVFPEISLPKNQRAAIEEFLTARAKPTIVVAGFEHLTWTDYEALAAEMPDTPQIETCDVAGTFVNVAGIWIRDLSGNVSRYLQPKLHPSGSEQPALLAGQNVLVFKSNDQASHRRFNFCVQICSDFCFQAFVENLRKAISRTIPGLPLDMLVLPLHNPNREAAQFVDGFDTYFDQGVVGSQTDSGCIVRVNNSAPNRGKSQMYGDSGFCFPFGRWRGENPPATYWMQSRKNHQAVTVREGGPGIYRFAYRPHCLISKIPGSGQETPFPGNTTLFAAIEKDNDGNPRISLADPLLAEAHWLENEWSSDRKVYQTDLEGNLAHVADDQRMAICARCNSTYEASFLHWKNYAANHPEIIPWALYEYLLCWSSDKSYPPTQREPNMWPDTIARAVGQFLRCYSLVSLGTNGAIQPYLDRNVHARWGNDVDIFFLWGGSRWGAPKMITEFKSRIPLVALITERILLVLVDPHGLPAIDSLRDNLKLDEHVVTGLETTSLPQHLKRDGTVTRTQRRNYLNLVGSNHLWEKVYSATDENDLVQGLQTILSEELATGD